jgi:hypothetical protein
MHTETDKILTDRHSEKKKKKKNIETPKIPRPTIGNPEQF